MKLNQILPQTLLAACCALAAIGCGNGRPAVVPVTGIVTHRGQPVAGAAVVFMSEQSRTGNGTTDEAGRFIISSYGAEDGAVLGKHKVLIIKNDPAYKITDNPYPEFQNSLPPRYANPSSTPLEAEVKRGEANEFTFELTD